MAPAVLALLPVCALAAPFAIFWGQRTPWSLVVYRTVRIAWNQPPCPEPSPSPSLPRGKN
jgi:hypothetical protein